MEKGYRLLGTWKGVPVSAHWTILLWVPWYLWKERTITGAALSFLAFFLLLLAHETGHALMARWRGLDVSAIKLYVLHGQCEHEYPHYEKDHVLVAWAGVLAQSAVLLCALILKFILLNTAPEAYYFLEPVFFTFICANIFMMVVNLVPVQPLDGYIAWRVVPLIYGYLKPRARLKFGGWMDSLNIRKRRALAKESERVAGELLDRIRKKETKNLSDS